ncbi:MAG: DUF1298 domain-containing protein, partial [Mycobacterium sp.]|nr:DUF1298 domain-containing protein [Mycobacterium sp.]
MTRMAAADAQFLWLSAKVPNDQFVLYSFDGTPRGDALDEVRRNATACMPLQVKVVDDHSWRYPRWVRAEVTDEQFVIHDGLDWPPEPLDLTRMAWRVHQYPGGVAVVQMSHALGDG